VNASVLGTVSFSLNLSSADHSTQTCISSPDPTKNSTIFLSRVGESRVLVRRATR
jgi:hypothetical protein